MDPADHPEIFGENFIGDAMDESGRSGASVAEESNPEEKSDIRGVVPVKQKVVKERRVKAVADKKKALGKKGECKGGYKDGDKGVSQSAASSSGKGGAAGAVCGKGGSLGFANVFKETPDNPGIKKKRNRQEREAEEAEKQSKDKMGKGAK